MQANLKGADLSKASLDGVDLSNADLRQCKLMEVSMSASTNLTDVKLDSYLPPPRRVETGRGLARTIAGAVSQGAMTSSADFFNRILACGGGGDDGDDGSDDDDNGGIDAEDVDNEDLEEVKMMEKAVTDVIKQVGCASVIVSDLMEDITAIVKTLVLLPKRQVGQDILKNTIQDVTQEILKNTIQDMTESQRKSWIKKTEVKVKTAIDGQLKGIIQELFEETLPKVFEIVTEIVEKETPIKRLSDSMERTEQANLEKPSLASFVTPVFWREILRQSFRGKFFKNLLELHSHKFEGLQEQFPELDEVGTLDALMKKFSKSAALNKEDPEVQDLLKQVVSSEVLTVAAGDLVVSLLEVAKHPAVAAAVLQAAKDNPAKFWENLRKLHSAKFGELQKQLPKLEEDGTLDALMKNFSKPEAISALLKDPTLHSAALNEADPKVLDFLEQAKALTEASGDLGASLFEIAKHPDVAAAVLKAAKDNPVAATAAIQGVSEAISPVMCTAQEILRHFVEFFNPEGDPFKIFRKKAENQTETLAKKAASKIADAMWSVMIHHIHHIQAGGGVEAGPIDLSACLLPLTSLFVSLEKFFIEDRLQGQAQKLFTSSGKDALSRFCTTTSNMLRVVCRYEDMLDEIFTSMKEKSGLKIESLQRFVGKGKVRCNSVLSNQRKSNAFEVNKSL